MRSILVLFASATLLPACFELPTSKSDVISGDFTSICADGTPQEIEGDLDLSTATDADVASLTCVTEIYGALIVEGNPELTGLVGLENVTSVNYLSIQENEALVSLNGLNAVRSLEEGLAIVGNPLLADLSGLSGLVVTGVEREEGEFVISDNDSLTTLAGLSPNRVYTMSDVQITDNDMLCDGDVYVFARNADIYSQKIESSGNGGACPVSEGLSGSDPCADVYSMTVEGDVGFGSSAVEGDLNAMRCVTSISGEFVVGLNDLTSLEGAGALRHVGALTIASMPELTDLTDLSYLAEVDGDVSISTNDALEDLGLESLVSVGGQFNISGNTSLTSISGFFWLSEVGSYFTISDNPSLETLNIADSLTHLSSDLYIDNNDALTSLSLDQLSQIDGQIQITDNDALTSLGGLNALQSVGGGVWIAENQNLSTLEGLSALTTVGGMFGIYANDSLTSITELSALSSVGSVQVNQNPELCSSQVDEVFSFYDGSVYNRDNDDC